MALINSSKPIIPLSSVAEILGAKLRTLRMYEDKNLLPKHPENGNKKLYSISDLRSIALVHYLASTRKVNANGIYFVLEMLEYYVDENQKEKIFKSVEKKLTMQDKATTQQYDAK